MSHMIANDFTTYYLDEEEALQGQVLTVQQTQVFQNLLSVCATEKLGIEYDTSNPTSFIQQEAYKKAQVETYRYILDASDAALQELEHRANNPNWREESGQ